MKTDRNIQLQIEKALTANSMLQSSNINVTVHSGEALLTGFADKFCKKELAKKIAKEVDGVKSVAEEILIVLNDGDQISDAQLEYLILDKFKKNFGSNNKEIKVIVKDGYVWLEGKLKWKYQKELAEECIGCLDGIKGIDNNIFIPESLEILIDEKDVLAAIYGDHSIQSDIKVEVIGHRIILKGNVESIDQKNLVTRLVRNVNGVKEVENFLHVDWMC